MNPYDYPATYIAYIKVAILELANATTNYDLGRRNALDEILIKLTYLK